MARLVPREPGPGNAADVTQPFPASLGVAAATVGCGHDCSLAGPTFPPPAASVPFDD